MANVPIPAYADLVSFDGPETTNSVTAGITTAPALSVTVANTAATAIAPSVVVTTRMHTDGHQRMYPAILGVPQTEPTFNVGPFMQHSVGTPGNTTPGSGNIPTLRNEDRAVSVHYPVPASEMTG